MARGKYYTDEQNAALLAIYDDNKGKQYKELGEIAERYNVAPNHKAENIAVQIGRLVAKREEVRDGEQVSIDEITDSKGEAFDKFLDMVLGAMTAVRNYDGSLFPKLDYKTTFTALRIYAPDKLNARLERLDEETSPEGQA